MGTTTGSDLLIIDYFDETTRAVDGVTFGRGGDIVVDADNQYLHAEAGRFHLDGGRWELHNTGSRLPLRLLHQSGLRVDLPPVTRIVLPVGHGRIQVTAGPTTYELDYMLEPLETVPEIVSKHAGTLFYGRDLSPAQTDYALTLAEPRLRERRAPLPTHGEIAELWGVKPGAVRRSFEEIRNRLRGEGVRAIDSQEQLLDYLIINRVVTVELLEQAKLREPDGPVRRASIRAAGPGPANHGSPQR